MAYELQSPKSCKLYSSIIAKIIIVGLLSSGGWDGAPECSCPLHWITKFRGERRPLS